MNTVVIVTNSLSGGGAERAMNLLAHNLGKFEELDIFLIPINAGPSDLVDPNCEILEIGRIWNGGLWDTLKAFARFQVAIFKSNPRFLILNCDLPEFYSAFAFWIAKCIIVEHTTHPWAGRKILGNLIRLILRTRGASYVRVSERIDISPLFKDQTIIPNIIDSKIIRTKTKQRDESNVVKKLIFVGRLSKEKRPELFIELAQKTGIESLIIGDGQLGDQLRQNSKEIVNLKFLGQKLNPWEYTSNRDLLVLTSDYEGDCLVALEAISVGIPVALRSTADLKKIGFPSRNYYDDIPDLAERITRSNFDDFKLSNLESNQIIKNRRPEEVSRIWLQFLLQRVGP